MKYLKKFEAVNTDDTLEQVEDCLLELFDIGFNYVDNMEIEEDTLEYKCISSSELNDDFIDENSGIHYIDSFSNEFSTHELENRCISGRLTYEKENSTDELLNMKKLGKALIDFSSTYPSIINKLKFFVKKINGRILYYYRYSYSNIFFQFIIVTNETNETLLKKDTKRQTRR